MLAVALQSDKLPMQTGLEGAEINIACNLTSLARLLLAAVSTAQSHLLAAQKCGPAAMGANSVDMLQNFYSASESRDRFQRQILRALWPNSDSEYSADALRNKLSIVFVASTAEWCREVRALRRREAWHAPASE